VVKVVGDSADQRNHVRFWLTNSASDGRPFWLGSASFDRGVGPSHDTGQTTHHIGPDVDAERDLVINDLTAAGQLSSRYEIPGNRRHPKTAATAVAIGLRGRHGTALIGVLQERSPN